MGGESVCLAEITAIHCKPINKLYQRVARSEFTGHIVVLFFLNERTNEQLATLLVQHHYFHYFVWQILQIHTTTHRQREHVAGNILIYNLSDICMACILCERRSSFTYWNWLDFQWSRQRDRNSVRQWRRCGFRSCEDCQYIYCVRYRGANVCESDNWWIN